MENMCKIYFMFDLFEIKFGKKKVNKQIFAYVTLF